MELVYLPANQAYAFTFGSDRATAQLLPMGDHGTLFHCRADAVLAAGLQGLAVGRDGTVSAIGPNPFAAVSR